MFVREWLGGGGVGVDRLTVLIRYGGGRRVKLAEKRTGTRDKQHHVHRTTERVHRHDNNGGGGENV